MRWNQYSSVFSGGPGILFVLKRGGELSYYRYTGTPKLANFDNGGKDHRISDGWNQYEGLFQDHSGLREGTAYCRKVLSLGPAGYWRLDESGGTIAYDISGNEHHGTYWGNPLLGEPGVDGSRGVCLNGCDQYIEVDDDDSWSQPTTGAITVVAWIRPDSLSMPKQEGAGYVHWMSKGESHEHEWAARMYQTGNSEGLSVAVKMVTTFAASGNRIHGPALRVQGRKAK